MTKRHDAKRQSRSRLDESRVEELLEIAAEAFISRGFAETSIAEIARRGSASKTTFYARYESKEDLFLAAIERRMARLFREIAVFREGATLEETLISFGESLLRMALSQAQLNLVRAISVESRNHPRLARHFIENGPKRGETALAEYLATRVQSGEVEGESPSIMARFYISLLTGSPIRWLVLDPEAKPLTPAAAREHVRQAAAMFLRAYRRPDAKRDADFHSTPSR